MNYPLGPFPPEILQNIVSQSRDVNTYQNLRLTSQRVRCVVEPILPEICRQPISAEEILDYLKSNRVFIQISRYIPCLTEYSITIGDLGIQRLNTLLTQYPVIDLYTTFGILEKRQDCMAFDPHYAKKVMLKIGMQRALRYYNNIQHIKKGADLELIKFHIYKIKTIMDSLNYILGRADCELASPLEILQDLDKLKYYILSNYQRQSAKFN